MAKRQYPEPRGRADETRVAPEDSALQSDSTPMVPFEPMGDEESEDFGDLDELDEEVRALRRRTDETRFGPVDMPEERSGPPVEATRITTPSERELRPGRAAPRPAPQPRGRHSTYEQEEEPDATRELSNRTTFSSQAAMIADTLRERVGRKSYGRSPPRVLRIDEPEGPSTAGGRQARQPILLVCRMGSAPPIMCGWVDVARREAQLRGYESASRRYEAQHGRGMGISPADYERFLDDMLEPLLAGDIKVRVLVPDEPSIVAPSQPPPPKSTGPRPWVLLLLVVLACALSAVGGFFLALQL